MEPQPPAPAANSASEHPRRKLRSETRPPRPDKNSAPITPVNEPKKPRALEKFSFIPHLPRFTGIGREDYVFSFPIAVRLPPIGKKSSKKGAPSNVGWATADAMFKRMNADKPLETPKYSMRIRFVDYTYFSTADFIRYTFRAEGRLPHIADITYIRSLTWHKFAIPTWVEEYQKGLHGERHKMELEVVETLLRGVEFLRTANPLSEIFNITNANPEKIVLDKDNQPLPEIELVDLLDADDRKLIALSRLGRSEWTGVQAADAGAGFSNEPGQVQGANEQGDEQAFPPSRHGQQHADADVNIKAEPAWGGMGNTVSGPGDLPDAPMDARDEPDLQSDNIAQPPTNGTGPKVIEEEETTEGEDGNVEEPPRKRRRDGWNGDKAHERQSQRQPPEEDNVESDGIVWEGRETLDRYRAFPDILSTLSEVVKELKREREESETGWKREMKRLMSHVEREKTRGMESSHRAETAEGRAGDLEGEVVALRGEIEGLRGDVGRLEEKVREKEEKIGSLKNFVHSHFKSVLNEFEMSC